jgi:4-hydroxy-tetrahydrodipicolinate synthase
LDVAGLGRLVKHVVEGGVHGLFLLGTTGESAALSGELRREMMSRVSRQVGQQLPVVVGVSDNSVVESLRLAEEAAAQGAYAIVLTTPAYLPVEQIELVRYLELFNRESPLPIILYNMPRLTSHWFAIDTIRQAANLERIIGLKDSSGDMDYFASACAAGKKRPDWSLLIGVESQITEATRLGACGCVAGGANVWPALLVKLYHASLAGDERKSAELRPLLSQLGELYQYGTHATGVVRGIKCATEMLGICNGRMADPFVECDEDQRAEVRRRLLSLGFLVGDRESARGRTLD